MPPQEQRRIQVLLMRLAPPQQEPRRYGLCLAVPMGDVDRVSSLAQLSFTPRLPADQVLAGWVDLGGRRVVVVDTARWLGIRRSLVGQAGVKLVSTRFFGGRFAFLAHRLEGMAEFPETSLRPVPRLVAAYSDCLKGVIMDGPRQIPLLNLTASAWEVEADLAEVADPASGQTRREVLLVHHSPRVRQALEREMRGAGFWVTARHLGWDAWEELKDTRGDKLPCLVICGVDVPGLDGFALCRRIRQTPRLEGLPVVLYATLADPRVEKQALEAGAATVVTKPQLPRLAEILQTLAPPPGTV